MSGRIFTNTSDLVAFATKLIKVERLPSLKKDVNICVSTACAFPALSYCFSTIDLLATLFKGQLKPTSANARDYMQKFMKNNHITYTPYEVQLLQKIYRHKVVHVAQPKPLIEIGADKITWRYDNVNLSNHLKIETIPVPQLITAFIAPYRMDFNKIFVISILKLAQDIEDSVLRPNDGYLDMLINNSVVDVKPLQDCFEDAVEAIYDPKQ
ncbi:MAG: hypothetical protein WAK17_16330 [Candidatus Nitrosopolaris sp.]